MDSICEKRNNNFNIYQKELAGISPNIKENGFTSNFAYPVIHEYRDAMVARLQKENIEVRPMICGSMGTQPFYVKKYGRKELPNVSQIDKYGFYIPNHPGLSKEDILKITSIIKDTAAERFADPYLQTR